jgi:fibronectin-binding autotransporter adhesin
MLVAAIASSASAATWSYDFGTTSGTTTHTSGSSSSFLPNPQANGGSQYVRVGSQGGSVVLANPGDPAFGSGAELMITAPTGSSLNKFGIANYTTGNLYSLSFSTFLTGNTGTFYAFAGNGSSFDSATAGFTSAQVAAGLQFILGTSAITTNYRSGSNWISTNLTTSGITKDSVLGFSIYGNNGSTSTSYSIGGTSYSLGSNTFDIWLGGSKISSSALTGGQLSAGSGVDSIMFYGENSASNVGKMSLDNIVYANELPAAPTSADYWAPQAGGGGTGIWTSSGTNWASAAGTLGSQTQGTGTLIFGNTAGTVTVSDTVSASAGMQLATTGYLITGGTISLAGATSGSNTITVNSAVTGTINSILAGSAGMTKAGVGTLSLGGVNTLTGTVAVTAGTLATTTSNVVADAAFVNVSSGAIFQLGGNDTVAAILGSGTVDVQSNTLTANTAATGSFAGVIQGTGGFTKTGGATFTLSGNNAYLGVTSVNAGTLATSAADRISNSSDVAVASGATLQLGGAETVGSIAGAGNVAIGGNAFTSGGSGSSTSFSGVISGAGGSFTKAGAGTLTINAAQAYTGATNVNAGTLALGASGAIATSPTVNVASGATLDVSAVAGFTLGATQTLAGAGSVVGPTAVSGTINPGDSGAIGTLTLGATTLNGGGVLNVALFDASSTAGTGWDLLATDTLTFANSSGSKFTINLSSASTSGGAAGNASVFNNASDVRFKIVGASSFGTSFDATAFTLNTAGFTNALGGGTWGVTSQGSDIYLSFTAGQALNWVGGSGTWAPTGGTDWNGGAWDSSKTATFAGSAGTVTVDNAGVSAGRGLDFGVTGYTLAGGPIALSGSTAGLNTVSVSSGSATVASTLTGNTGLTKVGAGALVLAADATFTGGTQINGGTVQLGNGGTAGTVVGDVTIGSGATLAVNRSDALTLSGNLTGVGAVTKSGSGTLTLSGSNDYAGGTTVNGGAVAADAVSRLGSGALTLNGGRLTYTGGVGTLASGSIGAGGGTFDVGLGGDLTITALTGTASSLVKEGAGTLRVPTLPAAFSANAGVLSTAQVGTLNMGTDLANAGTIEFTGSNTRVNLNVNQTGSGVLRLTQSSQSVANTGSNITGTAANPIALAVGSGTVNIGSTSGNTLRLNGAISGTGNVNFAVSTSGGAGLTVLGAASTFTGNVTVNSSTSGIHRIGVNNAIPTTAGVTFGSTAGSIDLNGFNQQLAYLASGASGGIFNSAGGLATLTIDGTTSTTYARAIGTTGSATIALVKAGSSTLTLSGSSAFSGGTTINGGVISVASDSSLGASSGSINFAGGTLATTETFTLSAARIVTVSGTSGWDVAATKTVTFNGDFAGSGRLNKGGLGQLTLGGTSAGYTGTFAINAGTVELTNADALDNAIILQTGGTLILAPSSGTDVPLPGLQGNGGEVSIGNGRQVAVGDNSDRSYGGRIRGQGGFKKQGTGRLELTGNNDYSGTTLVNSGRLVVNGSLSQTPLVTVASGAEIGGSGSIGGTLAGAGAVGPGNSPGIFSAPNTDPSGGLDYNFEFTGLTPDYTNAAASVNDVLRLTDTTTPFLPSLGASNAVKIYLPSSVAEGQTYVGGFFLDATTAQVGTFLGSIASATFSYFVQDNAGGVTYEGLTYRTLGDWNNANGQSLGVTIGTSNVASAAFVGGTITNGQSMQMVIVPEPSAFALAGLGAALAGYAAWKRRRPV